MNPTIARKSIHQVRHYTIINAGFSFPTIGYEKAPGRLSTNTFKLLALFFLVSAKCSKLVLDYPRKYTKPLYCQVQNGAYMNLVW